MLRVTSNGSDLKLPDRQLELDGGAAWYEALHNGLVIKADLKSESDPAAYRLILDLAVFEERLIGLAAKLNDYSARNNSWAENLTEKAGCPELSGLLLKCSAVQNVVDRLLLTDQSTDEIAREQAYISSIRRGGVKISELIGNSACTERAALGVYVLSQTGIRAACVIGTRMKPDSIDISAHAYVVLPDYNLVWEPSSKHSEGITRLLKPEIPFTLEHLSRINRSSKDRMIYCENILKKGTGLLYGI